MPLLQVQLQLVAGTTPAEATASDATAAGGLIFTQFKISPRFEAILMMIQHRDQMTDFSLCFPL